MFKVGDVIGVVKLKNMFGPYAVRVLDDFIQTVPDKKRGARSQYKIISPLPTKEQYLLLRDKKYTRTVADVVSDSFSTFCELKDELQEWYDNLPESFQQGDKGNELEDTINCLDACGEEPDVPEWIGVLTLVVLPSLVCTSRSDRCSEASGALQEVNDMLGALLESEKDTTRHNALAELMDTLQSASEEADTVSFPGMY